MDVEEHGMARMNDMLCIGRLLHMLLNDVSSSSTALNVNERETMVQVLRRGAAVNGEGVSPSSRQHFLEQRAHHERRVVFAVQCCRAFEVTSSP